MGDESALLLEDQCIRCDTHRSLVGGGFAIPWVAVRKEYEQYHPSQVYQILYTNPVEFETWICDECLDKKDRRATTWVGWYMAMLFLVCLFGAFYLLTQTDSWDREIKVIVWCATVTFTSGPLWFLWFLWSSSKTPQDVARLKRLKRLEQCWNDRSLNLYSNSSIEIAHSMQSQMFSERAEKIAGALGRNQAILKYKWEKLGNRRAS